MNKRIQESFCQVLVTLGFGLLLFSATSCSKPDKTKNAPIDVKSNKSSESSDASAPTPPTSDSPASAPTPSSVPVGKTPPAQVIQLTPIAVPASVAKEFSLSPFYKKYIDAGLPILSSEKVDDKTLITAAKIVRSMLQNYPATALKALLENHIRVAIIGLSEKTTDIPEHSDLYDAFPETDWDVRARGGLGATLARPATSTAEENIVCSSSDVYKGESILVHEFSHTLHLGISLSDRELNSKITMQYGKAKTAGRWANTYAIENELEFFAETAQSYLNSNLEGPAGGNGIHGNINSRAELLTYDPEMHQILQGIFGNITIAEDCNRQK